MEQIKLWIPLLLASLAPAQQLPTNPALSAAIAIEELEHDAKTAATLYESVARGETAPDNVRRHAWLRLAQTALAAGDTATATEALRLAAVGDDQVAKQAKALAQQDPQDPKRTRELTLGARRAVEQYAHQHSRIENVLWYGDIGVDALIREYRDPKFETLATSMGLWVSPGAKARDFIAAELGSEDQQRRHDIAHGLTRLGNRRVQHSELVRKVATDPDPSIAVLALFAPNELPVKNYVDFILASEDDIRSTAIRQLSHELKRRLPTSNIPAKARISAELARVLPSITSGTHESAGVASQMLSWWGLYSPEGRALLAARIQRIGSHDFRQVQLGELEFPSPEPSAAIVAAALANQPPVGENSTASTFIQAMLLPGRWTRSELDPVLDLARHDHLSHQRLHGWLSRNATEADCSRVVAKLRGSRSMLRAADWLSRQAQISTHYVALREAVDSCSPADQRDVGYDDLLVALARTGRPETTELLRREFLSANPAHPKGRPTRHVDKELILATTWNAQTVNDAASRSLLREMLQSGYLPKSVKIGLFGQLVHLGDTEVWTQFDAIQRLSGPREFGSPAMLPHGDLIASNAVDDSSAWLTLRVQTADGWTWWHGYDSDQLTAIWTRVLQPREFGPSAMWNEVTRVVDAWLNEPKDIPEGTLLAICSALTERFQSGREFRFEPQRHKVRRALAALVTAPEKATSTAPRLRQAIAKLHLAALSASTVEMRVAGIRAISENPSPELVEKLRTLIDSTDLAHEPWQKLQALGNPIDRQMISTAAASPAASAREIAVHYASQCSAPVTDLIIPLLSDPKSTVQIAACQYLAAQVDYDSVPSLLETLRDSDASVRKAAASALQAIRLYHDEKSRWARVLGGKAQLGPAAAAEALIDQAAAGNDQETRLLAIRSLGVLGAAETLPLLIGWAKDSDADIAATAREAIQQIHARAK